MGWPYFKSINRMIIITHNRSWVMGYFNFDFNIFVQHKFLPSICKWRYWNNLLPFIVIQFQCRAVDLPTGDGYYKEFHWSFLYSIQQWPWLPQLQYLSTAVSICTAIHLHLWWCLLLFCSRRSRHYADSAYWYLFPWLLWYTKQLYVYYYAQIINFDNSIILCKALMISMSLGLMQLLWHLSLAGWVGALSHQSLSTVQRWVCFQQLQFGQKMERIWLAMELMK